MDNKDQFTRAYTKPTNYCPKAFEPLITIFPIDLVT